MACGRRPSKQRRAARDFPDIARRCNDRSRVASTGGQLCGQVAPAGARRRQTRAWPRPAAQKNGTEKPLNINHLQHSIAAAEATTVRNASIGAAVELSPRASGRFCRWVSFSRVGLSARVWSVGALVGAVAALLEQELSACTVAGEISNFSRAASGHCYFTLKDPGGGAALALRHVPARRVAARLRAGRRPARRAARPPRRLRAARRAAVHRRGDAVGRRRRAVRALPSPARASRGRGALRSGAEAAAAARIPARSASSRRWPVPCSTTSRRRWRAGRRTCRS